MLTLFIKYNNIFELTNVIVVNVENKETVEINTKMDDKKLNDIFNSNPPGTEIKLSDLPYIKEKFLSIVDTNGTLMLLDSSYVEVDVKPYYSDLADLKNKLYSEAVEEGNDKVVIHSKYVYNERNKKLDLNPLYKEPFIIVPDIGQSVQKNRK